MLCSRCQILIGITAATLLSPLFMWADIDLPYGFVDRGGISLTSHGGTSAPVVGYDRIEPFADKTSPSGLAIFGFRQNGVFVTEAGVPASHVIQSGRIYAEVNGQVNTGLAIANPNDKSANISFYFADQNGSNFRSDKTTIPANGQIAAFLDQPPFNGGASISGTLTFSSDLPISVVSLRGLTNERSEFLITTLPVSPLAATNETMVVFPHFADGGGWVTQVILINPTDKTISGMVHFFDQGSATVAASPVTVTVAGQSNTAFSYAIPARSSRRLRTSGLGSNIQVGSVRVIPEASDSTPAGVAIFSFKNNGVTVSEAGVPATAPAQAVRLYAEASADTVQIQTGIAIANTSDTSANATLELTNLNGGSIGSAATITVPSNGQVAVFLNQVPGLGPLPVSFQGVLRISAASTTGLCVVGLRGRINERGDFLITSTPPVGENVPISTEDVFFPHIVDKGGYTTQFILFNTVAGQSPSGVLSFYAQDGESLDLAVSDLEGKDPNAECNQLINAAAKVTGEEVFALMIAPLSPLKSPLGAYQLRHFLENIGTDLTYIEASAPAKLGLVDVPNPVPLVRQSVPYRNMNKGFQSLLEARLNELLAANGSITADLVKSVVDQLKPQLQKPDFVCGAGMLCAYGSDDPNLFWALHKTVGVELLVRNTPVFTTTSVSIDVTYGIHDDYGYGLEHIYDPDLSYWAREANRNMRYLQVNCGSARAYKVTISVDDTLQIKLNRPTPKFTVTPNDSFVANGPQGSLDTGRVLMNYQILNTGTSTFDFSVSVDKSWLSVLPSSGRLSPNASATIGVSLTAGANNLVAGSYNGVITFASSTTTVIRSAQLLVSDPPPPPPPSNCEQVYAATNYNFRAWNTLSGEAMVYWGQVRLPSGARGEISIGFEMLPGKCEQYGLPSAGTYELEVYRGGSRSGSYQALSVLFDSSPGFTIDGRRVYTLRIASGNCSSAVDKGIQFNGQPVYSVCPP